MPSMTPTCATELWIEFHVRDFFRLSVCSCGEQDFASFKISVQIDSPQLYKRNRDHPWNASGWKWSRCKNVWSTTWRLQPAQASWNKQAKKNLTVITARFSCLPHECETKIACKVNSLGFLGFTWFIFTTLSAKHCMTFSFITKTRGCCIVAKSNAELFNREIRSGRAQNILKSYNIPLLN